MIPASEHLRRTDTGIGFKHFINKCRIKPANDVDCTIGKVASVPENEKLQVLKYCTPVIYKLRNQHHEATSLERK
jgi:hypothetical protein